MKRNYTRQVQPLTAYAAVTEVPNKEFYLTEWLSNFRFEVRVNTISFTGGTAPTLTFALEYYDPVAGTWNQPTNGITAGVTAAGRHIINVGKNVTAAPAAGGVSGVSMFGLPGRWRVVVAATGSPTNFTVTFGSILSGTV